MKVNEIAAAIHRRMCEDGRFGYSWDERYGHAPETWTIGGERYVINVGDYDCSSSVITAWRLALSRTGYAGALDGATYTGDIRSVFAGSGLFAAEPAGFVASTGDLYLNEANHVAMCQTQVPDVLSEFSGNEFGGAHGGRRGDQTGDEAHLGPFYEYPWDCVIHYNGKADGKTSTSSQVGSSKVQPRYNVMSNGRWLGEMRGKADTTGSGDDFAGIRGAGIQYLACDARRYRVKTQVGGWLPWVTRYDTGDLDGGCAGDGSAIVAIEIADGTVRHRAHTRDGGQWLPWMVGQRDTGGSADKYAGDGTPIDLVQMVRA